MTAPCLGAALDYARRGWRVFPLHGIGPNGRCTCGGVPASEGGKCSPGKHPHTEHGCLDSTTDEAQIRAWWTHWPDASVGIATGPVSGLWVLDVDPRHGGDEALRELERLHAARPNTPQVLTGGGGWHDYWATPPEWLTTGAGKGPLAGLDWRGEGGYVVAPPSTHASGRCYAWELSAHPDDLPLAAAPAWLLDAIRRKPAPGANPGDPHGADIPEGQRNDALTRLGGAMRRHGAAPDAILAALLAENAARCMPPLEEREVHCIAASVARYEPAEGANSTPVKLPWHTAAQIAAETPEEVPWLVRPWVAEGAITQVTGKPKAGGKTTWMLHLVRALLGGVPFMGAATHRTAVVYLSEGPPGSYRRALDRAGLLGAVDLHVLYWHEVARMEWPALLAAARAKCEAVGAKLLVVDTFSRFTGLSGDLENNSGAMLQAVAPLQAAAGEGLSVVIVHHDRKSEGEVGDSGRGSGALTAAVDVVLSIRRPKSGKRATVRELHALSRYDETPDFTVIDLTPRGFVLVDEAEAPSDAEEAILAALPDTEADAATEADLQGRVAGAVAVKLAVKVLRELLRAGRVLRVGKGGKKDPFRYFRGSPRRAGCGPDGSSTTTPSPFRGRVVEEPNPHGAGGAP